MPARCVGVNGKTIFFWKHWHYNSHMMSVIVPSEQRVDSKTFRKQLHEQRTLILSVFATKCHFQIYPTQCGHSLSITHWPPTEKFTMWLVTQAINLVKLFLTKLTATSLVCVFLGQRARGSSQLRFSVFAFMCSSSGFVSLSSSRCWVFLSFITCGSHQVVTLGAATVCSRFPYPPPPPSLFPSTDYYQCWPVPGMGAHGWVAGICQPWERYSI